MSGIMRKPLSAVALLGLASGCGLALTSMVTSYWMILVDDSHLGLFYHCNQSACNPVNLTFNLTNTNKGKNSHFKAVRGLSITGLILGLCGFLMALGFVVDAVRSKGVKSLALLRSSLVLNPLGGAVTLLGGVIFSSTVHNDIAMSVGARLGFSFALCLAGGFALMLSGVLVYVGGPREVTLPSTVLLTLQSRSRERRLPPPCVVMACLQPPPHYSPPTEQYLLSLFHPPPDYMDNSSPPPSYEDDTNMPPPYTDDNENGEDEEDEEITPL